MKKRFLKAAAIMFTAGTLLISSYGGLTAVSAAEPVEGEDSSCPVGDDFCDGGDTCPHRNQQTYDPGFDDYGRKSQRELAELAGDEWRLNLKGSRQFGSILVKTPTGETLLVLLEATEEGMVLRAYYKGEAIAETAVLTENAMVMDSYTIALNNGKEKTVDIASEPTGASGSIDNIRTITLVGAAYERVVIGEDVLVDFFAAVIEAM